MSLFKIIISFLIGLILIPGFLKLMFIFIIPYFGLNAVITLLLYGILLILSVIIGFFINKIIGFGALIGMILSIIFGYLSLIK